MIQVSLLATAERRVSAPGRLPNLGRTRHSSHPPGRIPFVQPTWAQSSHPPGAFRSSDPRGRTRRTRLRAFRSSDPRGRTRRTRLRAFRSSNPRGRSRPTRLGAFRSSDPRGRTRRPTASFPRSSPQPTTDTCICSSTSTHDRTSAHVGAPRMPPPIRAQPRAAPDRGERPRGRLDPATAPTIRRCLPGPYPDTTMQRRPARGVRPGAGSSARGAARGYNWRASPDRRSNDVGPQPG
jgi:hypothetical protein